MNALEEFNNILRNGYNSETLLAIKSKLDSYLPTCPEEDKKECQQKIDWAETLITECKEVDNLQHQYDLFHNFVIENKQLGDVELEYIEPYGNSVGVDVKVYKYVMELVFKPMAESEKNEVRTRFFLDVGGLYKQFMLRKKAIPSEFANVQFKRRDYYPTSVRWDNWGSFIINSIKTVTNDPVTFLQMCKISCPYNEDGSHKFKSWKTRAKIEVTYDANTGIIQGVKNGETPFGAHVVGGNGSFRFFNKGDYVLKIELDCLADEMPIKHSCFVNIDSYVRQLKEAKGWGRNLPYQKVNQLLNEKIEVITYDMNKDPEERDFYPVDYEGNWLTLLKEKLHDL